MSSAVSNAIERDLRRIDELSVEEAGALLLRLNTEVKDARSEVLQAKIRFVHRAIDQGFTPRRLAEMLDCGVGYIHNLRTGVNGRGIQGR